MAATTVGIVAAAVLFAPVPATAADGQTAQITIGPSAQSQPTGAAQTYNIAVSCAGAAGTDCGPGATITIPLDTTTTPPMTHAAWLYSATAGVDGLIASGPTVVGNTLVITLNDALFVSGFSGTIRLQATPPNNVTPNNTAWSMDPVLTGDNIDETPAPAPAESIATAKPNPVVTKVTDTGGSVYAAGQNISYTIKATCSVSSVGYLFFTEGRLVDQLLPGFTFLAADSGGVYDPVANTVTWSFPDEASVPQGCADGAGGANDYHVLLRAPNPAPAPEDQPLINKATFSGSGPDATDPTGISADTSAQVGVQVLDVPPDGGGPGYATIHKSSLAPLAQPVSPGNQYIATYPGD